MISLKERDKKVIWHPYTQMLGADDIIPIISGKGAYLYDENGNSYLDAISSWWTNIHGHSNEYINQQISEQLNTLEHVLFAGFTHPSAVELAERLLSKLPGKQSKAFYSDNGSTSVEVGLKMAVQYWTNKGQNKSRLLAFENAYHGDTFGSMSVSHRGQFTQAFAGHLFETDFIPVPVKGKEQESLYALEDLIRIHGDIYAAFIYEPLVQGAAGMIMYEAGSLDVLLSRCRNAGMLCIADEVMTGFGRTGELFASSVLKQRPDIICLSKAITGGYMPLGMTTCTEEIFNAFLSHDQSKTFYHGHSYTANPIACRAALASLDLLESEECKNNRERIENRHREFMTSISDHKCLKDIRIKGTILAFELNTNEESGYFNVSRNFIYRFFIGRGILIRPLGNIIYIMPPYCISDDELSLIYKSISDFLVAYISKDLISDLHVK